MLSVRDRHRDMIEIGAYKSGANQEVDEAIALYPELERFLIQSADEIQSREQMFVTLQNVSQTRQ